MAATVLLGYVDGVYQTRSSGLCTDAGATWANLYVDVAPTTIVDTVRRNRLDTIQDGLACW